MIDPLPSDIFKAGEVLNNTYEVEGVVGRGGLGEVYRVRNNVTGRVFAIKALNAQYSDNADYVELMKREEEMRHIINDAVVRYIECSRTDDGHVILVMDYVAGPSLADEMVERQVSEKELLIVAHRIAQGLEAAHAHGIVHRDLSPDNIILRDGSPEQATLIDFGIAKDTSEGARTIVGNDFAGKYEYAAPEQVDGNAEAKSDLYALGSTLLAAYRGETPFLGTTPGEIVRRKQAPLELNGVPDQLRELVERLSAPDPADRPADAPAAVLLIEGLLNARNATRPVGPAASKRSEKGKSPSDATPPHSRRPWVLSGVGVLLLGVLGYGLSILLIDPLPTVRPYTLSASKAVFGRTMMDAHAPDQETADTLVDAFEMATGAPREAASVTLAEGMPDPDWATDLTVLVDALGFLERWELTVSDRLVSLTGLAADQAQYVIALEAIESWQAETALSLNQSLQVGPEVLSAGTLLEALAGVRNCGALKVESETYELGDTITVTGNVADPADIEAIKRALEGVTGSRNVETNTTVLNPDICAIRDVMPFLQLGDMSARLSRGIDGSPNLTGVYRTGENPVVDILVPATETNAFIWVLVVDNTGQVFHVLPNLNEPVNRVGEIGVIEGGLRRITVLHPRSILASDPKKLVVEVIDGSYGKSEVIAILTSTPLFDGLRPRVESTTSAKEALTEALIRREGDIVSVTSRIIDARE